MNCYHSKIVLPFQAIQTKLSFLTDKIAPHAEFKLTSLFLTHIKSIETRSWQCY